MAHRISLFKHQASKDANKLYHQDSGSSNTSDFSSIEMEIISKINSIAGCLKDLEDTFSKTSQDLLKKTTLEGRESDKIRAVQGKIISNKKKYYQNLESDVDTLSGAFNEQVRKITRDLTQLQVLAKGKASNTGSSGENYPQVESTNVPAEPPITSKYFGPRYSDLPIIRPSKGGEVKLSASAKLSGPFAMKLRAPQENEIPKRYSFNNSEVLMTRSLEKPKVFTQNSVRPALRTLYKMRSNEEVSQKNTLIQDLESKVEGTFSPMNFLSEEKEVKSRVFGEETLSDSNIEEEGIISRRSRPLSCSFVEDREEVSIYDKDDFKF